MDAIISDILWFNLNSGVTSLYLIFGRRGKYPLLFTDTEANNCFSIYNTSLIAVPK